jgi:[CysO sulfur-carrier protein]-S-L-cysteine hydrolase
VKLRLRRETLDTIDRHAIESYPSECCGAVLAADGEESVRRISNIQDRLHREDPTAYPRDARTAYFMDPKELLAVLKEADDEKKALLAFYHSHPEHAAYFSAEDKARAMAWDEPAYPDARYLVVSVTRGAVGERLAVAWDPEQRDFKRIDLVVG